MLCLGDLASPEFAYDDTLKQEVITSEKMIIYKPKNIMFTLSWLVLLHEVENNSYKIFSTQSCRCVFKTVYN